MASYQYTLDENGNRAQSTETESHLPDKLINNSQIYTYNTPKNRLTGSNPAYSYDNEGQLKTQGSRSYGYDNAHRLISLDTASYVYDGLGNRIQATRNGVVTKYIYDAGGNLLAEANASNTITKYYIYGLGLTAMVDAASNQLYVYHFDGTGSITNTSKQIVNSYAYDPFGKIMYQQETISQPFKYAGQVGIIDEGNNVYYMRARYYDANLGRFISEDPAGFEGGLNLFAYVGGNPVIAVDPSGLICVGCMAQTIVNSSQWGNIGVALFNLNPRVDSDLEKGLINHYFKGSGTDFVISPAQWQQVLSGVKSGNNSYYDQGLVLLENESFISHNKYCTRNFCFDIFWRK